MEYTLRGSEFRLVMALGLQAGAEKQLSNHHELLLSDKMHMHHPVWIPAGVARKSCDQSDTAGGAAEARRSRSLNVLRVPVYTTGYKISRFGENWSFYAAI